MFNFVSDGHIFCHLADNVNGWFGMCIYLLLNKSCKFWHLGFFFFPHEKKKNDGKKAFDGTLISNECIWPLKGNLIDADCICPLYERNLLEILTSLFKR